jgi:hypothetical protein
MKLVRGTTREDRSRDIFWQRGFVEDEQGKILCKIIVCATQEFLSMTLKKEMASVRIDDDMNRWFDEKFERMFEKAKTHNNISSIESLLDIYPQTNIMLQFAQSVQ